MTLVFPAAWRFKAPNDGRFANRALPQEAVEEFLSLIIKMTAQGDRQEVLEHFKASFCTAAGASYNWSSSPSWADSDLRMYAYEAAENAPLFIEAFYNACDSFDEGTCDAWAPDVNMINAILSQHGVGYVIDPPKLQLRDEMPSLVPVASPSPTLAERAAEILQQSLGRSEELLSEDRGREAVQESLWLLETVSTSFRGVKTTTGTVKGKYFNRIVGDLAQIEPGGSMKQVLEWITTLYGYLSSPTGGGVRHGLDLNKGVPVGKNEARLFCNLIRSYLSYLLVEHQRLGDTEDTV